MPAKGQETIHWRVIQKIRKEGFQNTEAMKIAGYLADVYRPRLANSPSYNEAAQWVYETFNSYGLSNVAIALLRPKLHCMK